MGLIQCPECGKMVSERAAACPECGCPVGDPLNQLEEPSVRVTHEEPSGNPGTKILFGFLAGVVAILAFSFGSYIFGLIMAIIAFIEFGQAFQQPETIYDSPKRNQQYQQSQYQQAPVRQDRRLCCANCGGYNINVSVSTVNQVVGSTREVREKNAVTRQFNKESRRLMNIATLGLWSLTPKPSDYKETEKVKTRLIQYKTAVCQTCGHSWNL